MRKYIGDRDFYRRVAAVLMPILIQQVITSFVSLLDNIMVGQVGTEPMSGVAIVNQLFFVYYLCVIGGLSGAGILTAQFSGKGDREGIRHSVRVKLILGIGICLICAAVLLLFGDRLIQAFLHEGESGLDLEDTLHHAQDYLDVMLLQILPLERHHQQVLESPRMSMHPYVKRATLDRPAESDAQAFAANADMNGFMPLSPGEASYEHRMEAAEGGSFMDMPVLLPSQAFDNRIRKASLRIARQREELNDLIDHDLTGY